MRLEEVASGVHRIESDIGARYVAEYVVVGEERTVITAWLDEARPPHPSVWHEEDELVAA